MSLKDLFTDFSTGISIPAKQLDFDVTTRKISHIRAHSPDSSVEITAQNHNKKPANLGLQRSSISPTRQSFRRQNTDRPLGSFRRKTSSNSIDSPISSDSAAPLKPVLPVSDRISLHLERDCLRASEFLQKAHNPVMPKSALKFANGLAFLWTNRAGFVGSYSRSWGFVIKRLGPDTWSAPCFLSEKCFSIGLTAGFATTDYCYAIPNEVDLEQLMKNPAKVGKAYRISNGAIVDVSMRCSGQKQIDNAMNTALYGQNISVEEILAGRVAIPSQFEALYELLASLSLVDVIKPTTSQFEIARAEARLASSKRSSFGRWSPSKKLSKRSSSVNISREISPVSSLEWVNSLSLTTTMTNVSEIASLTPRMLSSSRGNSFKLFNDIELLNIDLGAPYDEDESEKNQPATIAA